MNYQIEVFFVVIEVLVIAFLIILVFKSRKTYKKSSLQLYRLILKDKKDRGEEEKKKKGKKTMLIK